ncbi:MAG TPA: PIG-L family deacetylase, partial [Candidatus Hydrogenedentes bacterium]|nr:PIG-L family deacetylase [Candidatus Hydrogenedentota bacterium]
MTLDVLAVGAHPDDVDLGVGGALCKLAGRGFATGILDLTRAERSTRGGPEEREQEAREAARLMGVPVRENAGLPDAQVANTEDQRLIVMRWLRELRPKVVL